MLVAISMVDAAPARGDVHARMQVYGIHQRAVRELMGGTTPAQRLGVFFALLTHPYQPSPKGLSGRPAHCPFRGLLSVHSRYGLHTRAVTYS